MMHDLFECLLLIIYLFNCVSGVFTYDGK
jgi:hypothetical protein